MVCLWPLLRQAERPCSRLRRRQDDHALHALIEEQVDQVQQGVGGGGAEVDGEEPETASGFDPAGGMDDVGRVLIAAAAGVIDVQPAGDEGLDGGEVAGFGVKGDLDLVPREGVDLHDGAANVVTAALELRIEVALQLAEAGRAVGAAGDDVGPQVAIGVRQAFVVDRNQEFAGGRLRFGGHEVGDAGFEVGDVAIPFGGDLRDDGHAGSVFRKADG